WDDALKAYIRAVELDPKSEQATGYVLNTFEALVCAERPEQLFDFLRSVREKGWELPSMGEEATLEGVIYHGYTAIALAMSRKDTSESLKAMRALSRTAGFKTEGWSWDELDRWLKTTRLPADVKAAVESIVHEMKGQDAAK